MARIYKERGETGVFEVRETAVTVSAAEAAPSSNTDGTDCQGFNTAAVSIHTLTGSPTYSLDVWLYTGAVWVQASGGSGAPAAFADLTNTFGQIFNIAGFDRVFVRVSALDTGSVDRSYTFVG